MAGVRKTYIAMAVVGVLLCLSHHAHGLGTVYDIDVNKYVGRWYNMYTNFWADTLATTTGAECTVAEYGKISETNVTVFNSYNVRDGKADVIDGYAWIPLLIEPGKLLVRLDGVPTAVPYWIIKLGPIVDDQYEYSVISDSRAFGLFVLARDPERFDMLYDAEVREYLLVTGFQASPTTEPVRVYQGNDCEYIYAPPK